MYDLADDVYRFRPLTDAPLDLARLEYRNRRERVAHDLLARRGAVKIASENRIPGTGLELTGKVTVAEDRREYRPQMLLADEGQVTRAECTCTAFRKQGLKAGPCVHLVALRLAYAEQEARRLKGLDPPRRSPSRRGPTPAATRPARRSTRSRWSGAGSRSAGAAPTGRAAADPGLRHRGRRARRPTSPGSPSWRPAASSMRRRDERGESRGRGSPAWRGRGSPTRSPSGAPSSRPGASRPTSTPSSPSAASWSSAARPTRCPTASWRRTRSRSRPRPRSGAAAARGLAGLQGRPTSSTSARGSTGPTSREPDKWDLPNAEERAAENELPPLDSPRQLAEALGLTVAELRWLAYHRDAATSIHYRRFTIPKRDGTDAGDLGPDAEAQGGPALDPPQHRREAARPRVRPRLPARPLDAHQRRGARRARRSW